MPVRSTADALTGLVRVTLGRATAGLLLAFLLAFPVRTFLVSDDVPLVLEVAWLVLVAVGFRWPDWSGVIVLASVPLLPIWPYEVPPVPHGIVHLAVASQAVPYLVRRLRAPEREPDPISSLWILFAVVGITSSVAVLAGFPEAFPSTRAFLAQVSPYLGEYIFNRIGRGIPNTVVAAMTLVDGWLTYALVRDTAQSGRRKRLVVVMMAAPVLVASLGVVQSVSQLGLRGMWREYDPGLVRINATYADPNALAAYFVLTLPLLVVVALGSPRHRARWPALACAVVVAWALILTAGRAGYAGAAVGLAAIMFQIIGRDLHQHAPWPRAARQRFRTFLLAGVAIAIAALLALTVAGTILNVTHDAQTNYLDTVLYTLNLHLPLNERVKGRLDLWGVAWLMIRDHPGLGIGFGMFYSAFPKYTEQVTHPFDAEARMSAHNTFLGIWAELGLLGLALWMALLGVALWLAFRRRDRFGAGDPGTLRELTPWIRVGLAAGLLGYVSTMFTGDRTILREDVVMLGGWLGLVTSFTTPVPALSRVLSRIVAVVLVGVLATLPLRAEIAQREVPLDRLTWGFHEWESRDDTRFRWTRETALFYVPGDATSAAVPVRKRAPFPQSVTVLINDVHVDTIVLTDRGWQVRRYALNPRFAREGYHRFELRVRPVWKPVTDGRTLGIMVGEISVTE